MSVDSSTGKEIHSAFFISPQSCLIRSPASTSVRQVAVESERCICLISGCHFLFFAFKHGVHHFSHTLFYYFCIREWLLVHPCYSEWALSCFLLMFHRCNQNPACSLIWWFQFIDFCCSYLWILRKGLFKIPMFDFHNAVANWISSPDLQSPGILGTSVLCWLEGEWMQIVQSIPLWIDDFYRPLFFHQWNWNTPFSSKLSSYCWQSMDKLTASKVTLKKWRSHCSSESQWPSNSLSAHRRHGDCGPFTRADQPKHTQWSSNTFSSGSTDRQLAGHLLRAHWFRLVYSVRMPTFFPSSSQSWYLNWLRHVLFCFWPL